MVFNDFIPSTGGQGLSVQVDGGSLEGGLAGSGEAPPAADDTGKLRVIDPGAEPRAARKYAFTANKTAKRTIVLRQQIDQAGQVQDMPALSLTVDLTPKKVSPQGTSFEMKVVSVDLADKDKLPKDIQARAAQELAGFGGLVANFEVDSHGAVGEVSLQGTPAMQRQGADQLVQAFQQAVELMLPLLPDKPIGVGAKWERVVDETQQGVAVKGTHAFEAKELTNEGGTIAAQIKQTIGKHALPDPRLRGATVAEEVSGNYTYAFRFDHVATRVEGKLEKKEMIEAPQPGGKPQSLVVLQRVSHLMSVAR
jgi:hypothetical protein